MKSGLAQDTTKSAKALAQQIARQMAQEPLEVLKTAKEQTTGIESQKDSEVTQNAPQEQQKQVTEQQKLQDKLKAERRMEALNRELDDIRHGDLFKELQEKISQGQEVMLGEYSELSREQKEVLNAQMEAVRFQKQQAAYAESRKGFQMPVSKRGRQMTGQKQEAEKQQTRVEKPVPPSG